MYTVGNEHRLGGFLREYKARDRSAVVTFKMNIEEKDGFYYSTVTFQ